jgi:hypothetical protein
MPFSIMVNDASIVRMVARSIIRSTIRGMDSPKKKVHCYGKIPILEILLSPIPFAGQYVLCFHAVVTNETRKGIKNGTDVGGCF